MASAGPGSAFHKYATFGKTEAQIKEMKDIRMETKNIQKLCKDTGVIDAKYTTQLLDNDILRVIGKLKTGGHAKYQKGEKTLCKDGFDALVAQIAESKKVDKSAVLDKINSSGGPSLSNTTGVANASNVARMTDTSNYTGAHKERFGADGKGKGLDGREDRQENTGYVGNYKGANTYDKKH